MKRLFGCVVTLALAATLVGCGSRTVVVADGQQANVITVNASSSVKVVPDKASFSAEVYAEGTSAEEAQVAAVEPVNAVIAALKDAGVDEKDIQTSYANLSPIYDWSGETERVTGYEMRTGIQVSNVDIDNVSTLMEAVVSAGATGVSGPNYYASTFDEAYAQALADAVTSSREKAAAVAKAANVTLGDVVAVTEGYQNTTYRVEEVALSATADSGGGSAKIAPGEVSIEAQVTVTYAIN